MSVYFAKTSTAQNSVHELIPQQLRGSAARMIDLLEDYYKYLNQSGLPNAEISSIISNQDIDKVSDRYLSQFQNEIAKTMPDSRVVDKITLYKHVVAFYKTRSTEMSMIQFFRIIFNATISVYYPGDDLFKTSDEENSYTSDIKKLQDGFYWQKYSYVIRGDVNISEWEDEFTRLMHPAGMKLFAQLIIEAIRRNVWNDPIDYSAEYIDEGVGWLSQLMPGWLSDTTSLKYHTPKYQPGWLEAGEYKLRLLLGLLEPFDSNHVFTRSVIMILNRVYLHVNNRNNRVISEWDGWWMYLSKQGIGALADMTIAEIIARKYEYNHPVERYFRNFNVSSRIFAVFADFYIDPYYEYAFFTESTDIDPNYNGGNVDFDIQNPPVDANYTYSTTETIGSINRIEL